MIDFGPVQSESKTLAIHAGSDSVYKRADPGVFSGAVNRIAASFPLQTVVLGGPAERPIADHIAQGIKSRVINLAGKTSLDSLVYVLEKVDLLITNDSGPMHIAAALKKPLVALFSNGYPAVFGPYGDSIRFRILEMDRLRRFGKGSINEVAAAQVAAFGEELLRGP
ncbi:MAG: glycosyltransferase family 9 protein [Desulfobacterales bacterium]|jgi:ADP-heptose:LPS heptosyltransferase